MPDTARERLLGSVPMGRVATRGEVVGSVLYLLSPAAGYTTGQTLRLDGGAAANADFHEVGSAQPTFRGPGP